MDKKMLLEGVRWYPQASMEQVKEWMKAMQQEDQAELLVLPNPTQPDQCLGILLAKYYTEELAQCTGVRGAWQEGDMYYLVISGLAVRGFMSSIMRKMRPAISTAIKSDELSDVPLAQEEVDSKPPAWVAQTHKAQQFLRSWTPAALKRKLDEYVVGQEETTRAVADFLYYHGLRQVHPELPQRPLMITGPSGSGKTEVWRVVNTLFGSLFPVRILDGSSLSCEGWSGNYKLDTYIDGALLDGGILVVDEFDKLTKPKHSSSGDNVSLDMQAEFLKLMEGEYCLTERRKRTELTSKKMGIVLVGAFESLRAGKLRKKTTQSNPIGFCTQLQQPADGEELTDGDFIAYGIMPEIVGRIATKCATKPLTDSVYMDIIRNANSRVSQLVRVLEGYGVTISDVITQNTLAELVTQSKNDQTGVRWVSAQVENRLLEAIYEQGLFQSAAS